MKRFFALCMLCTVLGLSPMLRAQLRNPIVFVTAVPTPSAQPTQTSLFSNHLGDIISAPRGGDLWIRYPDGSLRNLTLEAGYGSSGLQGANAIAVREPNVHWSGKKVVFSMVVGAPTSASDTTKFYWQLYEITGIDKGERPKITKIPSQPEHYNNISPIYGTDDKIIFVSDAPLNMQAHLYPQLDEIFADPSNTGLWSLNPANGELNHIAYSPSGAFTPTLDSYGRVLFTRWDHLGQDRIDGGFNYTDENPDAPQSNSSTQLMPENPSISVPTSFLPWSVNEDGSNCQTINHAGRHDFDTIIRIPTSSSMDVSIVGFDAAKSGRKNKNIALNFFSLKEDPTHPGRYYTVDATPILIARFENYYLKNDIIRKIELHGGGQLLYFDAPPTLAPEDIEVHYVTERKTRLPDTSKTNKHSGFYRDPLPTSDGYLLVAHTTNVLEESTVDVPQMLQSQFDFRLKFMQPAEGDTYGKAGENLNNTNIVKSLQWYSKKGLASFSGALWELNPVEVIERQRPQTRKGTIADKEQEVLKNSATDEKKLQAYLEKNNLAVIVMRDLTHRDAADKQQPYNLQVTGTEKKSATNKGTPYFISHLQILQGNNVRAYGKALSTEIKPGRRIIPQTIGLVKNPHDIKDPEGTVRIAPDGSAAAFVPAGRALTWQITDDMGTPVVRERYWLTFKKGEIRTCASCHGSNTEAPSTAATTPQNKPMAFNTLLEHWKSSNTPPTPILQAPFNKSVHQKMPLTLKWSSGAGATKFQVNVMAMVNNIPTVVYTKTVSTTSLTINEPLPGLTGTEYTWNVTPLGEWFDGNASESWTFTTKPQVILQEPKNISFSNPLTTTLKWQAVAGVNNYHLQISTSPDFTTMLFDDKVGTTTSFTTSELEQNTWYYWRVNGTTATATSEWSDVWSFATLAGVTEVTEESQASALTIAPNPAQHQATISLHTDEASICNIKVLDALGREVMSFHQAQPGGDISIPLPLTSLVAGSYTAVVQSGSKELRQRFVVIR